MTVDGVVTVLTVAGWLAVLGTILAAMAKGIGKDE